MKKNYIAPSVYVQMIHAENMIAASLNLKGTASGEDALVKGSNDWDIFGDAAVADDTESGSFFDE